MNIEHFKMERLQSTWENVVDYNLSESGVHPLSLHELAAGEDLAEIGNVGLGYSQTNGLLSCGARSPRSTRERRSITSWSRPVRPKLTSS